jgi:hypothetical protein
MANNSEEGQGSHRAVMPMMMIMIMNKCNADVEGVYELAALC